MAFLKKKDVQVLFSLQEILSTHKELFSEEEQSVLEKFSCLMESVKKSEEEFNLKMRESMRQYRSTPEGREKSRINQRKANRNYYLKQKAKKTAKKAAEEES